MQHQLDASAVPADRRPQRRHGLVLVADNQWAGIALDDGVGRLRMHAIGKAGGTGVASLDRDPAGAVDPIVDDSGALPADRDPTRVRAGIAGERVVSAVALRKAAAATRKLVSLDKIVRGLHADGLALDVQAPKSVADHSRFL